MRFSALLFDCDGVLVDSEPITNGVLRDMLHELGWMLSTQECVHHFIGRAVKDQRELIEHHTRQPLTEDWLSAFRERRNQALEARLQAVPHIHAAMAALQPLFDQRMACASGADRFKVEMQLKKVALHDYLHQARARCLPGRSRTLGGPACRLSGHRRHPHGRHCRGGCRCRGLGLRGAGCAGHGAHH